MKYLILLYICLYNLPSYLILGIIILDVFLSNKVMIHQMKKLC